MYIGAKNLNLGDSTHPDLITLDDGEGYRSMTWIGTKYTAGQDTQIKNFKSLKISYNYGSGGLSDTPVFVKYITSSNLNWQTPASQKDDRLISTISSILDVKINSADKKSNFIQTMIQTNTGYSDKIGIEAVGVIFKRKKVK